MRSAASTMVVVLGFALGCTLVGVSPSPAQEAGAKSQAELTQEAASANSLYAIQNMAAALPLYEDLHQQQPESNVWREHLAACLVAVAQGDPAYRQRARQLLLDAKAAGDNSNFLQIMLEKLSAPAAPAPTSPPSPGMEALKRAEKAFSTGDLPTALKGYEEAMAADPKMYEAPLFAGDTEYKQGHYVEADQWYARAVAINPDRETAYRYWGDCLMKQGDPTQAEGKFIDAVVAEPYIRTPRIGLKQWADLTKTPLSPPVITLPARATADAKGNNSLIVDPSQIGNPLGPAVLAYSIGSAIWRQGEFKKTFPSEAEYRHSLPEEAQSIRVAISTLAKVPPDKLDVTWRTLIALDKDGMLECWILLDHPDQGIAQDYVAYRAQHRDLLREYIAKYDVHPK